MLSIIHIILRGPTANDVDSRRCVAAEILPETLLAKGSKQPCRHDLRASSSGKLHASAVSLIGGRS
jgi:hypothetical protein